MKGSKALLVTLLMAAVLAALAVGTRGPYTRWAARHWQNQISTVPDDRIRALLDQAAALGEPGIPVLVEALGAERESVARAGSRVLSEQLDRWQHLQGRGSADKQWILAESLAAWADAFSPAALNDAAQLATRILLRLPNDETVDRGRVIAACEKVLLAAGEGRRGDCPNFRVNENRTVPFDASAAGSSDTAAGATRQADLGSRRGPEDPLSPDVSVADLAPLPGGGLPIELLPAADGPPRATDQPPLAAATGRPGLLANSSSAEPLDSLEQPGRLSAVSGPVRPVSGARSAPGRQSEPTAVKPLSLEEPEGDCPDFRPTKMGLSPSEPDYRSTKMGLSPSRDAEADTPSGPVPQAGLSGMETIDLMRQLQSADSAKAAAARAELARRKFTPPHLGLARRLFDPDPEVRAELARSLPGLGGVDARPWLLWLSRDQNVEVRLAAITIMATSSDPVLLEQIETMARDDPDPRIQDRADRIARQRSEKRR